MNSGTLRRFLCNMFAKFVPSMRFVEILVNVFTERCGVCDLYECAIIFYHLN